MGGDQAGRPCGLFGVSTLTQVGYPHECVFGSLLPGGAEEGSRERGVAYGTHVRRRVVGALGPSPPCSGDDDLPADGFLAEHEGCSSPAPPEEVAGEVYHDFWEPATVEAVCGDSDDGTSIDAAPRVNGGVDASGSGSTSGMARCGGPTSPWSAHTSTRRSRSTTRWCGLRDLDEWAGTPGTRYARYLRRARPTDEHAKSEPAGKFLTRRISKTSGVSALKRSQKAATRIVSRRWRAMRSSFWVYPPEPVLVNDALERAGA